MTDKTDQKRDWFTFGMAVVALIVSVLQAIVSNPIFYDNYKKPHLIIEQVEVDNELFKNVFFISNSSPSKVKNVQIKLAIKKNDIVEFFVFPPRAAEISYEEMTGSNGYTFDYLKIGNVTIPELLPSEVISIRVAPGKLTGEENDIIIERIPAIMVAIHADGFAETNANRFTYN